MSSFFFFNDTATTEIYTLSLHDALPISSTSVPATCWRVSTRRTRPRTPAACAARSIRSRSEEHTSELQSHLNLVCRLLLEKKKITQSSLGLDIQRAPSPHRPPPPCHPEQ